MYHKVQYSKVPKYDSSAAILGTVIGAFSGYLALATVGSGGTDLTDLTALVSWALLCLLCFIWSNELRSTYLFMVFIPIGVWVRPVLSLILSLLSLIPLLKKIKIKM